MRVSASIIGGTGIGSRLRSLPGYAVHVPTRLGIMRCRVIEHENCTIAIVSRHAEGHSVPPHRVNYRAIALGLKQLGAKVCFSSAAVGALHQDWPVGSFAVCSDFLDFSARNLTLFDMQVRHTDFSQPFDPDGQRCLTESAMELGAPVHPAAIYVNANGPRYETPAEIALYRKLGGDVVGMTAGSEAIAMREAGVPYACLAVVTNLASGIGVMPLAHEEVAAEMDRVGEGAMAVLLRAAARSGKSS